MTLTIRSFARLLAVAVPLIAGGVLAGLPAAAGYEMPPDSIREMLDAPSTPLVSPSPDHAWMLLREQPNLLPLGDLARPELRLAGRRLSPDFGPSRGRATRRISLQPMVEGGPRPVAGLPEDASIYFPSWSPDSRYIAFALRTAAGFEAWLVDVAATKARRLAPAQQVRLNASAGSPMQWAPDSKSLFIARVPEGIGEPPRSPQVPGGPVVQQNLGKASPARTYQDLLQNQHDEALFDYYMTMQLARLDLGGAVRNIGASTVMAGFNASPDGRFLLVERMERPYSYIVPASRFPRSVEVWNMQGQAVAQIAKLPLHDAVPTAFGSVPTGRRGFDWRDDAPATLVWAEAQDGGDARRESDLRDRVYTLDAPFDGQPRLLASLGMRFGGVLWGDGKIAMVTEWWWKTRQTRTWIVSPDEPDSEPRLLFDRSFEDRYNDPGTPMTVQNGWGRDVLLLDGTSVFMTGQGASPEGNRPFVDKMRLDTKSTERLWRSEAPHYEQPFAFLDERRKTLLTRRESKTDPPNFFARDLGEGTLRRITDFPHPTPQLAGLNKELIKYKRADGVDLNATLYLPPGYSKQRDGALPVVVWAYPREFKSADAASQISGSPYRFDRVRWASPLLFLAQGYAVIDNPTMPIIGEGEAEPNDTYIEQLVSSAKAALDEVGRRGVGDPKRAAIGGHSYGAFMTANLLAHSDLFQAGIARSGAYNRTLTPFGFQAEERTFWEAPEIYFAMSPFMHAAKIDEPILLIHGEADNNSGTFPMQSERLYGALKGLGGTVRLVMLPHESHGYRARESIMHMWWEQLRWLDEHVKAAKPAAGQAAAAP